MSPNPLVLPLSALVLALSACSAPDATRSSQPASPSLPLTAQADSRRAFAASMRAMSDQELWDLGCERREAVSEEFRLTGELVRPKWDDLYVAEATKREKALLLPVAVLAELSRPELETRILATEGVPFVARLRQQLERAHGSSLDSIKRTRRGASEVAVAQQRDADSTRSSAETAETGPSDAKAIDALTQTNWSEFDERIDSTAPSLPVLEASLHDRRAVHVSLTMSHDDGVEGGGISLMYVGDDWLWLTPEMQVALPGDGSMRFRRVHSNVERGGICIEVMRAGLTRGDVASFAEEGFAMEVPRVGIVRVPGYYFEGLLSAFDRAKAEHGVDPSAATK